MIHPEDIPIPIQQLESLFANQSKSIEYRIVTKSQKIKWMRDFARPLWDSNKGRLTGILGAVQDISARKQAEEEIKLYADELERSNEELEQFASVASHDLQEPLRKIEVFGDRIKSRYGEALDERGQDYVNRMQNAARRMRTLINDLLTFSRITTTAQPFVPVNLFEAAQEVISDLEARIKRTGGRVELGDLPTIDADPIQMRQLFQNLIGNGLKFHQPEEPPVVSVQAQLLDRVCQITVKDNGIGFDIKYLDRIFEIFQRLHGRFQYEGTGIGLAICRKIVERHGGSITAKSTPGQGATFIVSLALDQLQGRNVNHEK
ncbi:MAG: PAS domain-containing protein [Chloroflexi bacterium]|nr:PAS domain-containing protein [Chloroflexota bacterium]